MKTPDRPTVPDVLPLARAVYARHAVGCCAHNVLDDANVADRDVAFCVEEARAHQHADCILLCDALAKMTRTQRLRLRALR